VVAMDEEKEKALIKSLSSVTKESREAIEGCFGDYYMIPKIIKMIDITEKHGVLRWTCRTDRGDCSFRIRNRHSDIKMLYDGRVLIRDSNDNRYEIENVRALDRKSQRMLANEL